MHTARSLLYKVGVFVQREVSVQVGLCPDGGALSGKLPSEQRYPRRNLGPEPETPL